MQLQAYVLSIQSAAMFDWLIDVVGEIMLKIDRSRRQIVDKLVELGTVEDRKILHKSRRKKYDKDAPLHIGAHGLYCYVVSTLSGSAAVWEVSEC